MKLSRRLQAVADFIEDGSSVFDIGADHGNLEIFLSTSRKINKIFAVDNKEGPYAILRNNTKDFANIKTKLSSGLDDYSSEYNTIVIAGMGGQLIVELLKQHPESFSSIEHLIIDPHKNIDETRVELAKLGFKIKEEKIVKEKKKYYFVIHLIKGTDINYTEDEILYGVNVNNAELRNEYIELDKQRKQRIKNRIEGK
ncbi:MAG: class I SAM-dependent methyltransferase [Bacilli bacterium]|nr:class I SAM-dependent methyltransferase [Bacilli bacterium]